jgi:hypothetical protein
MSSRRTTDGRISSKPRAESFTVLPRSIRAKHVDIDTVTPLRNAVRQALQYYGDPRSSEGRCDAREHWASAFALDGLRNTFDFAFYVTTDGVSASFHFKRPMTSVEKKSKKLRARLKGACSCCKTSSSCVEKAIKKAESTSSVHDGVSYQALADNPGARIIGIDPGRTNIMVTAELVDGKLVSFRLTRVQYKTDTGMKSW